MFLKVFFLLSLLFGTLFANALKHVTINKHDFSFEEEHYKLYDSKSKIVKIYQKGTKVKLFTLSEFSGDCTSRGIIEGSYEIADENITFYTMWRRQGDASFAPYGARIEHYRISDAGKLEKIDAKIYLEESSPSYDLDSGMQYLFTKPKTKEARDKLATYVKETEEKYKATFVFDQEATSLIKEVKNALRRKMRAIWNRKKPSL